jgi:RecJ-like exonuclease
MHMCDKCEGTGHYIDGDYADLKGYKQRDCDECEDGFDGECDFCDGARSIDCDVCSGTGRVTNNFIYDEDEDDEDEDDEKFIGG